MNILEIIEKKKNNLELTKAEINYFVTGVTNETIPDYQVSALLMAIYFNSMTDEEMTHLTMEMANSGDIVDLSGINKPTVDKHSTGGVGDKTSLVLTSILACFNVAVAKMSGRGLGHTGGTIDKLESLAGFSVEINKEQFIKQVNEHGQAIIAQSQNLVPADKKLYALRDVTATVDSIPLIAASIMAKKIASGASTIILDVKFGSGAFMKDEQAARKLAEKMVMIGNNVGRKTIAIITSMEQPLGYAIGNVLEVEEALACLSDEGPEDLLELTTALAAELLVATDNFTTIEAAIVAIEQVISDGSAYAKFVDFITAQGANEDAIEAMPIAEQKLELFAEESGYIKNLKAIEFGHAAALLGAGRMTKTDEIDLAVGIVLHKKVGDYVEIGDLICELQFNDEKNVDYAANLIAESIELSPTVVKKPQLIKQVIR